MGSGGVGHSHCKRQVVDIASGGGWKLCVVHIVSGQWQFTLQEVGGGHCEQVAVASCGWWALRAGSGWCAVHIVRGGWWS